MSYYVKSGRKCKLSGKISQLSISLSDNRITLLTGNRAGTEPVPITLAVFRCAMV